MQRIAFLAAMLLASSSASNAQSTVRGAKIDPKAKALLDAVGAKYRSLPGYADEGQVTLRLVMNGVPQDQKAKKILRFARPNRLNATFDQVQYVTDGKTQTSSLGDRYWSNKAPDSLSIESLASNPGAAYYFGGATGAPSMALFRLLTAEDAAAILEGVVELQQEDDRPLGDKPHHCLTIKPVSGPLVRLLVEPDTMLLTRVEIVPGPGDVPPGVRIQEISWTSGTVRTTVPPDDAFVFIPQDSQTKVETIAELMAAPGESNPVATLLNNPAPDFKCQLVERDGKLRPISRDDLRGKVVLIDFWATWCGPCLKELPDLALLIEGYAKGPNADNLRVLALSIDEGDADKLTEVRVLVERKLVDLRLDPRVGKTGLLGLDPLKEVASAFSVSAIPMLVLIDAEGTVRRVHVGLVPGIRATLTKEIDELLKSSK